MVERKGKVERESGDLETGERETYVFVSSPLHIYTSKSEGLTSEDVRSD